MDIEERNVRDCLGFVEAQLCQRIKMMDSLGCEFSSKTISIHFIHHPSKMLVCLSSADFQQRRDMSF